MSSKCKVGKLINGYLLPDLDVVIERGACNSLRSYVFRLNHEQYLVCFILTFTSSHCQFTLIPLNEEVTNLNCAKSLLSPTCK